MHYSLMTGLLCLPPSFHFAPLTLTVLTTLRSSIREKNSNPFNETVGEVVTSQA